MDEGLIEYEEDIDDYISRSPEALSSYYRSDDEDDE